MLRACVVWPLLLAGCAFNPGGPAIGDDTSDDDVVDGRPDDDGAPPTDAPDPIDVAYLPPAAETPGTGDWVIDERVDLDTTLDAQPFALPDGVTLVATAQTDPSGDEVLVLHVRDLTITEDGLLSLEGKRPFAIVAGGVVRIDGDLDANSLGQNIFGPGGKAANTGAGAGSPGVHPTQPGAAADSGGGGGGLGTIGGPGGSALCATGCTPDETVGGGPGGPVHNVPPVRLVGGSGGGSAATVQSCAPFPGGTGGGAVFIYAATAIRLGPTGAIKASGGGGGGGRRCPGVASTAGSGGGAGGMIDLQSPVLELAGGLSANGGGGGAGADVTGTDANPGEDGHGDSTSAAGGTATGNGGSGGAGAAGNTAAQKGSDVGGDANAGGGGGGAGLIVIRHRGPAPTVVASPSATFVPF
ncbi:MAG TPA: hypothetical protein VM734_01255 [Kofleriaceae bacterium]|nr:hypothetical protein [Kofleriaceae bacterium]